MLEGDLTDFTLPDILRLLAFTSKTGRLRIDGSVAAGRVDLVDGRVRDASSAAGRLPLARRLLGLGVVDGDVVIDILRDADPLPTDLTFARELVRDGHADVDAVAEVLHEQTVDAVFDLLRWDTGSFRFDVGLDGDDAPSVRAVPVDDLLAEAERRLAAWAQIEAATGAGDAVVTIAAPRAEGRTVDLDADGWALLAFVDGRRTVDDLVALSGRGQFDTRRTLGAMLDAGVVRVGDPGAGGAVQRLLDAHRALADIETQRTGAAPAVPEPAVTAPAAAVTAPAAVPEPAAAEPVAQPPVAPASPEPPAPPPTAEPPSEPVRQPPPAEEQAGPAPAAQQPQQPPAEDDVTPLRTKVRSGRLAPDPTVDAELVNRLIDGVEGL